MPACGNVRMRPRNGLLASANLARPWPRPRAGPLRRRGSFPARRHNGRRACRDRRGVRRGADRACRSGAAAAVAPASRGRPRDLVLYDAEASSNILGRRWEPVDLAMSKPGSFHLVATVAQSLTRGALKTHWPTWALQAHSCIKPSSPGRRVQRSSDEAWVGRRLRWRTRSAPHGWPATGEGHSRELDAATVDGSRIGLRISLGSGQQAGRLPGQGAGWLAGQQAGPTGFPCLGPPARRYRPPLPCARPWRGPHGEVWPPHA